MDNVEAINFPKQRNPNPTTKSCHNGVFEELPSEFAAIISSNLKLVYLKRSLIVELLKQPETFDGINRSNKDELHQEILLRLSNVPKDVPISKISDDDFSEEECQDLYQRMTNGLLKKPTILELEQKARTLHEDRMKHWISREIALLRNRIDLANEKGWRRELAQYMDRKQELESPSVQSRLLSEIPKVIPEMVDTNLSPDDSSRKDKLEQNDLPELAIEETYNSIEQSSTHVGFAQCLDKRTDVLGPKTPVKNDQDDTVFPANVEQLSVHTASQGKDTSQKEVIELSDSDEDVNIKVTSAGRKGVESPDTNIWHCSGIYGSRTGMPVSLSALKRWSEFESDSASSHLEFKVWKAGESEREAMSLRDALKLFFP